MVGMVDMSGGTRRVTIIIREVCGHKTLLHADHTFLCGYKTLLHTDHTFLCDHKTLLYADHTFLAATKL